MANAAPQVIPKPSAPMTLAGIRKGKIQMPVRAMLYGLEGVGKSTWAAGAPKPIFLGAESGTMQIDIDRIPEPSCWADALEGLAMLDREKHDYQSIVVDPINWLEPIVFHHLTNGASIDDYGGGYGRGYNAALDQWRIFLSALEKLWRKGMHVLLTAHAQVKSFQNPEGPAFDRYEIAMNNKASGLFKQWCDFVLFARMEAFTKVDPGTKKAKGYSTGARVIHTQWTAAYDAKTRLKLPEEIPLSWTDFWEAVRHETHRGSELVAQIAALVKEIGDEKIAAATNAFVEKNKTNADRLAEIANRLSMKLDEKRKAEGAVTT